MPALRNAVLLAAFFGCLANSQVGGGGGGDGSLVCNPGSFGAPNLRASGFSELVVDIALLCTGGAAPSPGTPIPAMTFTVAFNTNVTSRLMPIVGDSSSSNVSEALLLIDDPGSGVAGYTAGLPKILCPTPLTGCAATVGSVVGSPTSGLWPFSVQLVA